MKRNIPRGISLLLASLVAATLAAQVGEFGRNKPSYEKIDFKVFQSPNFEVYSYLNNETRRNDLIAFTELWYDYHRNVFQDGFPQKNPIIFYNDHADFQQTNAVGGPIGVGTGGVTEAFKNRVIMPIALTNQATYQVLGHELVHAFQFNTILNGDSTSLQNLGNLPLWMVEGMAEYMSIGSVDPHTALWMRSAVLNNDVPTLDQLNNPRYFPYRYGHAFWAFLTGLRGDDVMKPLFKATALFGFDVACQAVLGIKKADLSKLWVEALKQHFQPQIAGREKNLIGKPILNEKDGGQMNISPSISPNGQYVLFISERNLFSTDVFLADANTGKILRTVASTTRGGNIDFFDYFESSGAWSPDSKQVALVAFKQGRNILLIKDVFSGKTRREIPIRDLPSFSNPAWSPNGRYIALSGLKDGQTDLYLYDLKEAKLTQLTNDVYSEIQSTWSADGTSLIFATDQLAWERGRTFGRLTFNLAEIEIGTQQVQHIEVFPGADNLNPALDTAGNILFLSNRDGYRNLYRYEPDTKEVFQLTDLATGITGISHYSPAISVDRKRDRVLYTHYNKHGYSIYRARQQELLNQPVDAADVTYQAAKLPRLNRQVRSLIDQQINSQDKTVAESSVPVAAKPFKSKFRLDNVSGGGGVGVGVGGLNSFGSTTNLAGAVQLLFSDILGNNQIFSTLSLNGEISDLGGMVGYLNRNGKLHWGGTISHIPFRQFQFLSVGFEPLPCQNCPPGQFYTERYNINRLFVDQVSAIAQLPFSSTFRLEASIDGTLYSQSNVITSDYYDSFGQLIFRDRDRQESPPGFVLYTAGAAAVGDNSFFGLTAPLSGYRYRIGVQQTVGTYQFFTPTADFRYYQRFKPVTLAGRILHTGRYGRSSDVFFPFYLGSPWWMRGYNSDNISPLLSNGTLVEDNLFGSKMALANLELRIPFTGPKQLALIPFNLVASDLNFFLDGGVAWFDFDQFSELPRQYSSARALFSAGASLRVNVFGALILEPYYAIPLIKGATGGFGLNFLPGW